MAPFTLRNLTLTALAAILALAAPTARSDARVETPAVRESPAQLKQRIESLDRALFEAFNRCDLEKLETFFVPELEFYHDNNGLTASRARFIGDVKNNVCGKFRRELVAGSLEVWPLGDYGAVYSGTHLFCKIGAAKCVGMGRFLHIWQNQGGDWKITRVVSYDHRPAP